jgi:hypothetical protein
MQLNSCSNCIDQIDFDALAVATGLAGNIAIPFVKQLTAIVKQAMKMLRVMCIGVQPVRIF